MPACLATRSTAGIGRIKRMFRWAVCEELAPASLCHALDAVEGLKAGRSTARETKPVLPVDDAVVEATLPHLPAVVADMVRLQRLLGCRPGEVCMTAARRRGSHRRRLELSATSHKTQHHGRERVILIGPRAQAILRPYLLRPASHYCFTPADSERKRKAAMRANRVSRCSPRRLDRRKSPAARSSQPTSTRRTPTPAPFGGPATRQESNAGHRTAYATPPPPRSGVVRTGRGASGPRPRPGANDGALRRKEHCVSD